MGLRVARNLLPALLALLGTLLPAPEAAQVSVYPPDATIPVGGSLLVNCSSDCNSLGLETILSKESRGFGGAEDTFWKAFLLNDIQEDDTPKCFSNCGGVQSMASMTVTVYAFPDRVDLAPLPPWVPAGDNFTLSCHVAGGAPRKSLSVVFLRDKEELGRLSAEGEDPIEMTVTSRREDHGANFSCRSELDLRPQGLELFQNSSASQHLQIFVMPTTQPSLVSPKAVEVGTTWNLDCSLDGLFPASEAKVHLEVGGQQLNPKITPRTDAVWAQVATKWEQEGELELKCEVTLAGQRREAVENVTFYSFPAPSLTLSASEVPEGTEVKVECEAFAGALATLRGAPARPPAPKSHFAFSASAQDHRRLFLCSATLEVAGQKFHKNQSRELHVLYGPRLSDKDCPGNWTWEAGSHQTLRCQPWGNPTPKLDCRRKGDDAPLPIGDLKPVKAEIRGTYVCHASSLLKTVTREVVVEVISPDYTLIIIIGVVLVVVLTVAGFLGYHYNRQRKIRKYELQKAQEEAALKLNPLTAPPE